MINNISEGTLRIATKIDPSVTIHDKEVHQQKAKQLSEARPVEASDSGQRAQEKKTREDRGSSRFLMGDRQMVFEKYDKNGDLVLRIPPSQDPVNKRA